jgi:hypothetical protein
LSLLLLGRTRAGLTELHEAQHALERSGQHHLLRLSLTNELAYQRSIEDDQRVAELEAALADLR